MKYDIVGLIAALGLVWIFLCCITQTIYIVLNWNINLYLPKRKKYLTKVNPIYEVFQHDYSTNYYIRKYELKYQCSEGWDLLTMIFLPLPIHINIYRFWKDGHEGVLLGDHLDRIDDKVDIEFIYEQEILRRIEQFNENNKISNIKQAKLDNFNKVFKENYE